MRSPLRFPQACRFFAALVVPGSSGARGSSANVWSLCAVGIKGSSVVEGIGRGISSSADSGLYSKAFACLIASPCCEGVQRCKKRQQRCRTYLDATPGTFPERRVAMVHSERAAILLSCSGVGGPAGIVGCRPTAQGVGAHTRSKKLGQRSKLY